MPDRTINFGDDAADARYRMQDTSSTGGDLVLAEDLDGGTVLLEYDYSASEWVSRGPVNLNGNDITNAGSISADSLEANKSNVENVVGQLVWETSTNQTVPNATSTEVEFDTATINDSIVDADPSNNNITINDGGTYRITAAITWKDSTNWSPPEVTQLRILSDGEIVVKERHTRAHTKRETFTTSITINSTSGTSISITVLHLSGSGRDLANSTDPGTGLGRLEVERV